MTPERDDELRGAIEAILLIADTPQSLVHLATALEVPVAKVREVIDALVREYDENQRGFELREVGGGWRLFVRERFDWAVQLFIASEQPSRLSQAALETLAIIAYRQPIARGQISSIRGVNVDSVLKTLLGRGLVTELFTDSETGAIHFGTTELLLEKLGINSLDELPLISPFLPDIQNLSDVQA